MRMYRIAGQQHIEGFRGLGASFQAGERWNRAGTPALYFAASAAVAMLEMAQYLPSPRLVPRSYRMGGVFEASDKLRLDRWGVEELPADWRSLLHGRAGLFALPSAAIAGGLGDIVLASPGRLGWGTVRLVETLADLYSPQMFA